MLIAAIAHDIERARRIKEYEERFKQSEKGFMDQGHMKYHQDKGAEVISDFLREQGAGVEFIDRVASLISRHEVGGSDDQNILKDADSISYFEVNAGRFIKKHLKNVGKEKIRKKFDWMFNRITSENAHEIARPFYEAAIRKLS